MQEKKSPFWPLIWKTGFSDVGNQKWNDHPFKGQYWPEPRPCFCPMRVEAVLVLFLGGAETTPTSPSCLSSSLHSFLPSASLSPLSLCPSLPRARWGHSPKSRCRYFLPRVALLSTDSHWFLPAPKSQSQLSSCQTGFFKNISVFLSMSSSVCNVRVA